MDVWRYKGQTVCQLVPDKPGQRVMQLLFNPGKHQWADQVKLRVCEHGGEEEVYDIPTDVLLVIAQLSMKAAMLRLEEITKWSGQGAWQRAAAGKAEGAE